jgi:hypothetical protein
MKEHAMREGMVKIKWRPSGQLGELREEIALRFECRKQLYIIRDEPVVVHEHEPAAAPQAEPAVVNETEPAIIEENTVGVVQPDKPWPKPPARPARSKK